MANVATFSADFGPFLRALEGARQSLQSFEVQGRGVAASLERLARGFSGAPIIAEAHKMAAAVESVGGAARLTAREQARVNDVVTEAIAKYRALGQDAPAALERLARETQQAGTAMGRLGDIVAGVVSAQAIIGVAQGVARGVRDLALGAIEAADRVQELHERLGESRAVLQQYGYAAQLTGTTLEAVVGASERLSVRLTEGGRETEETLRALGLSLDTLRDQTPLEALGRVAEALAAIESPAERSGRAIALLGRGSGEIIPLLTQLSALREEANRVGAVMDDELVESSARLNDAWDALMASGKGLIAESLTPIVPLIAAVAERMRDGTIAAREATGGWRGLALGIRTSVPLFGAAVAELDRLAQIVRALTPALAATPPPSPLRAWHEAVQARALAPPDAVAALETLQTQLREVTRAARDGPSAMRAWRESLDRLTGREILARADALVAQLRALGDPRLIDPARYEEIRETLTGALQAAARLGVEVNREWQAWIQRVAVLTYQLRAELAPALESIHDLAIPPLPSRDLPGRWDMRTPTITGQPPPTGGGGLWDRLGPWLGRGQQVLGVASLLGLPIPSPVGRVLGGAAAGAAIGTTLGSFGLALPALGPIGAIAGGVMGLISLFRGSEESRVVNPARDRFLAQFGGPGTGEGSGFMTLASRLASLPASWGGGEGGGALFRSLTGAKTEAQYQAAQAAIEAALARQNALLTEQAALEQQLAALRESQQPTWQQLEAAASRYGITLEALGRPIQQLRQTDLAASMLEDLQLFERAGGDMGGILAGMADEFSALIQDSRRFGTELPENLRPYVEELLRAGKLVDEHGQQITDISDLKWGPPIKTQAEIAADAMAKIADRLEEIADILAGRLPRAAEEGVEGVDRVIRGYDPPEIVVRTRIEPGEPGDVEGFQGGSGGVRDFGRGTLAVLHGREAVLTEAQYRALSRGSMGGREIVIQVPVALDGWEIARATARWQASVLPAYGA